MASRSTTLLSNQTLKRYVIRHFARSPQFNVLDSIDDIQVENVGNALSICINVHIPGAVDRFSVERHREANHLWRSLKTKFSKLRIVLELEEVHLLDEEHVLAITVFSDQFLIFDRHLATAETS